ncbi:GAF and ANTAR domain-containing protein [Pseudarthrobacter sp. NPDC058329]|uniref:GAF and ANTAR domain-containing protein n=1 Tax=Pseudarthrobacter sp. NPDC058329 TaxID=3346448 RepID=UPI0036DB13D9
MEVVDTDRQNEDFQQLHQLIAESEDIKGFLDGMTTHAASSLSRTTGAPIACAVNLRRHKRTLTVAGSSNTAVILDRIEQELGHGPCLEAIHTFSAVLLADTRDDQRWPLYSRGLDAAGYRSVLGLPVDLGDTASASLNFFAPATGLFTEEAIHDAMVFTQTAGQALRLTLRIITAELLAEDLKAAMKSRTDIDLACGMIMTQNRCTQEQAYQFILRASNHRNMKVHAVAEQVIRRLSGAKETVTHFED